MDMSIGIAVYLLITLIAGVFGLIAMIRCYMNYQERIAHSQQILDEMYIGPAQNFIQDLTSLAGTRADDNRPECTICISEFIEGEAIRILLRCRHGFHANCIEQWLLLDHSSCPTCRTNCRRILPAESSQQEQEQEQQQPQQLELQQQQPQQLVLQQQLELEIQEEEQEQEEEQYQQEPEQQLNDVVDDIESFFSAGNFSAGNCM